MHRNMESVSTGALLLTFLVAISFCAVCGIGLYGLFHLLF